MYRGGGRWVYHGGRREARFFPLPPKPPPTPLVDLTLIRNGRPQISTEYLAVRNTRRSISTIKHNALSSVYGWTMPKKRIEIFEFNHCTSLELSPRFVHFFFPSTYKYSIYYPVLIFFGEKRAGKKYYVFFGFIRLLINNSFWAGS